MLRAPSPPTARTWAGETRRLGDHLAALVFSDKSGHSLAVDAAFQRWRDVVVEVRRRRRVCYFIGNGASASLASHYSADLAKNGHVHTQVFSDPALVTAVSNDSGYERVFVEPLEHMANAGDLLVAISSSGASPNIIAAVDAARRIGLQVVTLSAMSPTNALRSMGDLNAYVPASEYGHAETCHAAVLHYWMDRVADTLSGTREPVVARATPRRFDRSRLRLRPLAERTHDLDISVVRALEPVAVPSGPLGAVSRRIRAAHAAGAAVLMMCGAHVLRAGVQRYVIDLMERGFLSGVALNGGGMIHDFEMAMAGATTESVARYIKDGQFGLWNETGRLNDIASLAAADDLGLGEAVGTAILEGDLPYKDVSVLAAGARLGIPVTVHVGIGYDIVHEHPNCDGAAIGRASYTDFLRYAALIERLDGGVVMNFGSAVMAPEVFLKALAMARNVAGQEGRSIQAFTTLVTDLRDLPMGAGTSIAEKDVDYYYRPLKTMLVRTVAGGGESYYLRGDHAETMPALWTATVGG